jgi:glucose/mannose transport system substrate-binding protein
MTSKKAVSIVLSLVVLMSLLLTACGGGATPTADTGAPAETTAPEEPTAAAVEPTTPPAEPTAATTEKQQVEVFSWWTGGGEAAGLEAMIKVFNEKYPDIEFVNAAVAGGAGTNARAVLATRLQAGDAPDSWQGHAGQELIGTYVAANQLEPLNFL